MKLKGIIAATFFGFAAYSYADIISMNKRLCSVKSDYSVYCDNKRVRDEATLRNAIETQYVANDIKGAKDISRELSMLGWLARGQELTMKYTDYAEWGLTFPAKLLVYIAGGGEATLESFKNLAKKDLEESLKEIRDNPEKQMKNLAYNYYSEARRRYDKNISIMERVNNGEILDYETARRFEENTRFIGTYAEAAQTLYDNALNLKPLEKRWVEKALGDIAGDYLDRETIEKIVYRIKDEYAPLKQFKEGVDSGRKRMEIMDSKRKESIDSLVSKQLVGREKNYSIVEDTRRDPFAEYEQKTSQLSVKSHYKFRTTASRRDIHKIKEIFERQKTSLEVRNLDSYKSDIYTGKDLNKLLLERIMDSGTSLKIDVGFSNQHIKTYGERAIVDTDVNFTINGNSAGSIRSKYYLLKVGDRWKIERDEPNAGDLRKLNNEDLNKLINK